jgi:branched-chain amino acid transport system ATP-binding protein
MLLEVNDVHVNYDGLEALKGISIKVEEGSIVIIIGPNGAGKSTTLKTICGAKRPTSGEIWFRKRRIDGINTEKIVKLGISHVPEGRRIFPYLTVLENLRMGAYTVKDKRDIEKSLEMVFNFFPVLKERIKQKGGSLSGGEQQMLAISRALMNRPQLLLMDEPTLGLSPKVCKNLAQFISTLNREMGTTILLVEQNARIALNIGHRGYVIESGRVVLEDICENLKRNERVIKIYLGG